MRRIRSNDVELVVETFGEGPAMVFAHGLSGTRHGVKAQLAPLADRYRIVVYDQRGHGDSTPVTDPACYEPRRMAEDMTSVLDALGIDRAVVGGESMGAATTLLFALAHPERVERLLITAPAFGDLPNPMGPRLKDLGESMSALGMEEALRRAAVRQRDELGWSPQAIEFTRSCFLAHDPVSIATALRTVVDWRILPDLSVVSTLAVPVCVIAWEADPLHPYELARRLVGLLPNASLEVIAPPPAVFLRPTVVGNIYRRFLEQLS